MKRLPVTTFFLICCSVEIVIGCARVYPPDDNDTIFFPDNRSVRISVSNAGRPVGSFGYTGQIIQLVALNDGPWVVPFTESEHVLHEGASTDIRIDAIATPFGSPLHIPVDDNITRRLFLFRSFDEDTGWRYLEITPKELKAIDSSDPVELPPIPDLFKVPPLSGRDDEEQILSKIERAKQKVKELPARRVWN